MALSQVDKNPSPDVSTTELLRALALEISEVVDDCRSLETVIGEIFSSVSKENLLKLQAFDLIIQRIDGAATVLEAMADQAPVAWLQTESVLRDVSLSDLASRLSGKTDTGARMPSGDAEFW